MRCVSCRLSLGLSSMPGKVVLASQKASVKKAATSCSDFVSAASKFTFWTREETAICGPRGQRDDLGVAGHTDDAVEKI